MRSRASATAEALKTCAVGDMTASAAAPATAPAVAPMLNTPWNSDMTGRRSAFSTAMPWAFIATSKLPIAMPKKKATGTKSSRVEASAGAMIATQKTVPDTAQTRALP